MSSQPAIDGSSMNVEFSFETDPKGLKLVLRCEGVRLKLLLVGLKLLLVGLKVVLQTSVEGLYGLLARNVGLLKAGLKMLFCGRMILLVPKSSRLGFFVMFGKQCSLLLLKTNQLLELFFLQSVGLDEGR